MAIAFGFLMGAITVFCIMKIAQLERTNKELLEKIEKNKVKEEINENPKEEEKYSVDRTEVSELPAKIEKEQKNLTIFVNLKGDYGNIMETSIKTMLSPLSRHFFPKITN